MNLAQLQNSRSLVAASILGVALALSGCAEKRFEAFQSPSNPGVNGNPTPTPDPGCTAQHVEDIYRKTKLIFVVDTSGSNVERTVADDEYGNPTLVDPTDPNKTFRRTVIQNFLNRFRHKTNFQWGMSVFAQDSSTALVNQSGNTALPIFSQNPGDLDNALTVFTTSISDNGNTPYGQALELAGRAIQNDPDKNSTTDRPNYYVILLTDGFPTDYYTDDGVLLQQKMNNDLSSLLGKASGQVNLSTVFYGKTNDQRAIPLLKRMAQAGGGQFANVSDTSSNFKIDDVIPGSDACIPN